MEWNTYLILFRTILLCAVLERCGADDCNCNFHGEGCAISKAAPANFKCKCILNDHNSTCSGIALPCDVKEDCSGNLAHFCACVQGGGNCKGHVYSTILNSYSKAVKFCRKHGKSSFHTGVQGSGSCKCEYRYGRGCYISDPAPFGWRCHCHVFEMMRILTDAIPFLPLPVCIGWAEQCIDTADCPGKDKSYCECQKSPGDCNGYRNKTENCPMACDCSKPELWQNGTYSVNRIHYDTNDSDMKMMEPLIIEGKDIINHTKEKQVISFNIEKHLSQPFSHEYVDGIDIHDGVPFDTYVPSIYEGSLSLSSGLRFSQKFGETKNFETVFSSQFICNGAAKKHTKCTVLLQQERLNVPYMMIVKHNSIPECVCGSYGVWTGILAHNARLVSEEVGGCADNYCNSY